MRAILVTAVMSASVLAAAARTPAQELPGSPVSLSTQPSMNVFRRYSVEPTKMTDFYGKVLGLTPMAPINKALQATAGDQTLPSPSAASRE